MLACASGGQVLLFVFDSVVDASPYRSPVNWAVLCLESATYTGSPLSSSLWFTWLIFQIGEGNGNPLQCSCLENPRDGGAWWAAVCGVAQSRTWLKWLSKQAIVNLQCYVSFRCAEKWFGYTYINILLFFFKFFPIIGYYKILNIVPYAIQQVLAVYLFYT